LDGDPVFFSSPEEMRAWLEANHATAEEVWAGIYKKSSGKQVLTVPQAVDQALCFGWIDSKEKSIDDERYMLRFTPRRPGSKWSDRNIGRVEDLRTQGLMHESGLEAFNRR
jgi:uncharacterized protein YdeI (YjbR/CyaY-like superfamily)